MQVQSPACTCAKQMYDPLERCSSCAQNRQQRMSRHKYILPERPAQRLTPPPSQPTTPRRSMEGSVTVAPSTVPRLSYANEALTGALNAEGSANSFPHSMHRHAIPSASRTTSLPNSRSPSETPSSRTTPEILSPASEQPGRKPSRSATPDALRPVQEYAPIAAGFARLSKKDLYPGVATDQAHRGRAGSARPSLELEARMFNGPA